LLNQIGMAEVGDRLSAPDFAGIVRNSESNVRSAFNLLEMELLLARSQVDECRSAGRESRA